MTIKVIERSPTDYEVWACLAEVDDPTCHHETFIIGLGSTSNEAIDQAMRQLDSCIATLTAHRLPKAVSG